MHGAYRRRAPAGSEVLSEGPRGKAVAVGILYREFIIPIRTPGPPDEDVLSTETTKDPDLDE